MRGLRRADTIQNADGIAVTIGSDVVVRLPGKNSSRSRRNRH
jgi:hypothetical protein